MILAPISVLLFAIKRGPAPTSSLALVAITAVSGVVVLPLVVTFFGFSQQIAQGTPLVAIVPLALLGSRWLTKSGFTQWGQGVRLGIAAAVGAGGGAAIALAVASQALQIGFAAVLLFAVIQLARKALR